MGLRSLFFPNSFHQNTSKTRLKLDYIHAFKSLHESCELTTSMLDHLSEETTLHCIQLSGKIITILWFVLTCGSVHKEEIIVKKKPCMTCTLWCLFIAVNLQLRNLSFLKFCNDPLVTCAFCATLITRPDSPQKYDLWSLILWIWRSYALSLSLGMIHVFRVFKKLTILNFSKREIWLMYRTLLGFFFQVSSSLSFSKLESNDDDDHESTVR